MKSRLQIQVNKQRHNSASEDWYRESAAVSPCQGHGCLAVNITWRLSLHVCLHFSLLKCQQWTDWKRERSKKRHQYICVLDAPCVKRLDRQPKSCEKKKRYWKKKVLLMAICRNVLHSTEFYKKKPTTTDVHFYFCFIFIHSTILYAHFPCTQGVLKSSTSCLWVKVGLHHREVSPRTHLGGNKVFLHILLILLTE